MIEAAAASTGAVACALAMLVGLRSFSGPRHVRQNYRGRTVVATAGIFLGVPLVIGVVWSASADDPMRIPFVIGGSGVVMALLGFIDDVYGDRHAGGLIGHARALLRGTFTTGMLKAAGGAGMGLVAAWALDLRGVWIVLAGAAIALASNMANLLDLRPGRVAKVWLPLAFVVAWFGEQTRVPLAAIAGGVVVFVVVEMAERVMLGDTGAGLLGASLGVAAVSSMSRAGIAVVLAVLFVLTLVSERVSFTTVIDAVPPLRWFDRLGRMR